jgi:hypothetical protein
MNHSGLMSDNGYNYPTEEQLRNIFACSCVESVARRLGVSPTEMYSRMKRANLFNELIYPCYDTLHTQSREVITEDIIEALNIREKEL